VLVAGVEKQRQDSKTMFTASVRVNTSSQATIVQVKKYGYSVSSMRQCVRDMGASCDETEFSRRAGIYKRSLRTR
jgi:hypothetical protein